MGVSHDARERRLQQRADARAQPLSLDEREAARRAYEERSAAGRQHLAEAPQRAAAAAQREDEQFREKLGAKPMAELLGLG